MTEAEMRIYEYETKPVIKKAMKFEGDGDSLHRAKEWLGESFIRADENKMTGMWSCKIGTLEGPHICSPGDYIIKGLNGEFYPCKPDVFEKTYRRK